MEDYWDTFYTSGGNFDPQVIKDRQQIFKDLLAAYFDLEGGLEDRPSLLEFGCGKGAITEGIYRKLRDYLGLDMSREALRLFRKKFKTSLTVRKIYPDKRLPLAPRKKFDVLLFCTVLQHMPEDYIKKVMKSLKKFVLKYIFLHENVSNAPSKPERFLWFRPREWYIDLIEDDDWKLLEDKGLYYHNSEPHTTLVFCKGKK